MADDIQKNVINHARADLAAMPSASHDALGPAKDSGPKIGAEHLKGMLKLGAHELTQMLAAFPESNIRPMEEPGVFGNETMPHLTPRENEQPSYNDRLNQAAEHGLSMRQGRDLDMGMDH